MRNEIVTNQHSKGAHEAADRGGNRRKLLPARTTMAVAAGLASFALFGATGRRLRHLPSRTSSSSSATTSARPTSAPIRSGSWATGRRTSTASPSEGMMFTDYYAENSCTAGRSSFITGQTPKRTGLSKVGIPGATGRPAGARHHHRPGAQAARLCHRPVRQEPPRRPQRVPADVHGFDEFFGNLYHLNAEEEPERPYWPKDDDAYVNANSPRGVMTCKATDTDDPTDQPHWGRSASRPSRTPARSTSKRMETIDDETTAAAIDFMARQAKASKPFFVWMNTTRMHVFTHVRPSMQRPERHAGQRICRRHDRARRRRRQAAQGARRSRHRRRHDRRLHAPTTARTSSPGRTPRPRRSAARRTPTGKAPSGCRRWSAGRATSSRARSPTRCSPASTGSRRCSPPPATRRSRTACSRAPTIGGNDLQGASRRLQPAALPDRPAAEERAHRVRLLQR